MGRRERSRGQLQRHACPVRFEQGWSQTPPKTFALKLRFQLCVNRNSRDQLRQSEMWRLVRICTGSPKELTAKAKRSQQGKMPEDAYPSKAASRSIHQVGD
jgi:hypothetical protein